MARLPDNLTIDVNEVSQTFNLDEITGIDLSREQDLKDSIAQALIDKMVSRYKSGVDLRGNAFQPYADSYKKSDTFEAFGKTDNVNMTLSNDMSSSMDKISDSGNEIKIGWNDATNNAKAYNHMVGDTVKKRQFFGLNKKDVQEVINEFRSDLDKVKKEQTPEQIIRRLTTSTESDEEQSLIINVRDLFG